MTTDQDTYKGLLDAEKEFTEAKKRAKKAKRASVYADLVIDKIEEEDAEQRTNSSRRFGPKSEEATQLKQAKLKAEEEATAAAEKAAAEEAAAERAEAKVAEKKAEVEKAEKKRKSVASYVFSMFFLTSILTFG